MLSITAICIIILIQKLSLNMENERHKQYAYLQVASFMIIRVIQKGLLRRFVMGCPFHLNPVLNCAVKEALTKSQWFKKNCSMNFLVSGDYIELIYPCREMNVEHTTADWERSWWIQGPQSMWASMGMLHQRIWKRLKNVSEEMTFSAHVIPSVVTHLSIQYHQTSIKFTSTFSYYFFFFFFRWQLRD